MLGGEKCGIEGDEGQVFEWINMCLGKRWREQDDPEEN